MFFLGEFKRRLNRRWFAKRVGSVDVASRRVDLRFRARAVLRRYEEQFGDRRHVATSGAAANVAGFGGKALFGRKAAAKSATTRGRFFDPPISLKERA